MWKVYSVFLVTQIFICWAESSPTFKDTYDFIVVGGGTSGCAIAGRLSENGKHSVLLLERGREPLESTRVPALAIQMLMNPNVSRIYQTTPQRNSQNQNGIINFITGNALGGTSSLNAMWVNRGSPYDYDNWARLTGDSSWKYSNLLRFFKKMESYKGLFPSDQHGYSGPITITRPRYAPALNDTLEAGRFLGFPTADANGPQRISLTPVEYSMRFGRRISSYEAYIRPNLGRRNLNVMTDAEVERILFKGNRATGVVYTSASGQSVTVNARKEVIVSAGVVNSPVILMRSGIGPRDVLRKVGIPIVKELPVGRNAHDHCAIWIRFILRNSSEVFSSQRDLTPENFRYYKQFGDGPYTFYGGDIQGFSASTNVPPIFQEKLGWADTQLYFVHATDATPVGDLQPDEVAVTGGVFIVRPKSRGTIQLNTTNYLADPLVDFGYMTDESDEDVMLEGIKLMLRFFEETPQFQRHGARLPPTPLPACAHLGFRSDNYWRCVITQTSGSGSHAAGSVRLGHEQDRNAVVDPRLRVIGTENLRVADCSIMPEVVNANTQFAAYVIAEKVSEDILTTWDTPKLSSPAFQDVNRGYGTSWTFLHR